MKTVFYFVFLGLLGLIFLGCTPKNETPKTNAKEPVTQMQNDQDEIGTIPVKVESYTLESGNHNGASQESTVFSQNIQITNAAWLQVTFSDYNLGAQSYIVVKSLKDGAEQKLTTESIKNWTTTAAFNGDSVSVALVAHPSDSNVFFKVSELIVGEAN